MSRIQKPAGVQQIPVAPGSSHLVRTVTGLSEQNMK